MFSITEALKWSFAAFKKHWSLLASIGAVNVVIGLVASIVAEFGRMGVILSTLVSLFGLVISYMTMVALYHVGARALTDVAATRESAWANAKSMFWPFVWVSILSSLFMATWAPTIVGFVMAVVFLSVVTPVLFAEGKRGIDAIATSIGLVKGKWWKTVGYMIVSALSVFIPVLLAIAVCAPLGAFREPQPTTLGTLAMNLFGHLLLTPFLVLVTYGLYRGLRASTVEPSLEVYAARRRFVKICCIIGVVLLALFVVASIVLSAFAVARAM